MKNPDRARAADAFDWTQPVGRDWNPCFALMKDGRFCGRAQRWAGHEAGHDHTHVSLAALLDSVEREAIERAGPCYCCRDIGCQEACRCHISHALAPKEPS